MTSKAEEVLCSSLRSAIAETRIGDSVLSSDSFNQALVALQYFLPEVLREIYPTWKGIGLDRVKTASTRKVDEFEIELMGACELLPNFRWLLLHLRLQIDPTANKVTWLECRVGDHGPDGSARTYTAPVARRKGYHPDRNPDEIDWKYKVTYGEKRT